MSGFVRVGGFVWSGMGGARAKSDKSHGVGQTASWASGPLGYWYGSVVVSLTRSLTALGRHHQPHQLPSPQLALDDGLARRVPLEAHVPRARPHAGSSSTPSSASSLLCRSMYVSALAMTAKWSADGS